MNNLDAAKITKMYEDGFLCRKIAKLLNYNDKEVKSFIIDNNLALKKEIFTEDATLRIKQLYKDGVSAKRLGEKFSIDKKRIQKWAKDAGMLVKQGDANRTIDFNQHIFDEIDDEHKAYWLGFFYADAYNREESHMVSLELCTDDIGHIRKLARWINMSEKYIKSRIDKEGHKSTRLRMHSKIISKALTKHGCMQAKSFIVEYPKWLSNDLHRHFIRGEFDGDGSIMKMEDRENRWRICIIGTFDMMDNISKIIKNELDIRSRVEQCHPKRPTNTYSLSITGNEQVKRFCDWIYQDHNVRLDRKYEQYLLLVETQKNRKFSKNTTRKNYLLSKEQKEEIKQDILNNMDLEDIAKKFKVSINTVYSIRSKMETPTQ